MSAPAGAQREPRPSAVSMRALLAAGVAATAVSTPPARAHVPEGDEPVEAARPAALGADADTGQAAPESEAA
ncbi:hypothetical protein ABZX75_13270 [Streptomyces sp. NPDC003038]|uniref:hypothetical protein n=1 Tax=unclassified Streptomyces TaxID=2593676 RepID=UPI0033BFB401